MTTTRTVPAHDYVDDNTRDHNDEGRCQVCKLPQRNAHHDVPDLHDAQEEHRRRTGEH